MAGSLSSLDLRSLAQHVPLIFELSTRFYPMLDLTDFDMKPEARYALQHNYQSFGIHPTSTTEWHLWVDGSFFPFAKDMATRQPARSQEVGPLLSKRNLLPFPQLPSPS